MKCFESWRAIAVKHRYFLLALAAAVVMRSVFFVGFVNDYGEENNHLRDALRVVDGEYLAAFDYIRGGGAMDREVNMIELYKFRLPVYLPSGIVMRALGVSDATLSVWFILCSLALVFLTYRLGATLYDRETGAMAALILAFFPFDVIWSSRINADVVLSLFFYLALWLVLSRRVPERYRTWVFASAGVVVGFAYLTKIVGLVFVPVILLLAVRRWRGRHAAAMFAGFFVVFGVENVLYYGLTGEWLLHYRTAVAGVEHNVFAVFPFRETWSAAGLTLHTYIDPLFYTKLLLGGTSHVVRSEYFFVWGWLAIAGLVLSVAKRKWTAPLLFLYFFAYFELGFALLRFNDGELHWYQIFKEPKYFIVALPVVSILAAQIPRSLASRHASVNVLFVLLVTLSLPNTMAIYGLLSPALDDVKSAADFAQREGLEPLFVDQLNMDIYLRLFSEDRLNDVRVFDGNLLFPPNAYVLVGGTRGLNLDDDALQQFYRERAPGLVAPDPAMFDLVREFPSRATPLRIYRVSNDSFEKPPPPELEINIAEQLGRDIEINGFVQGHGAANRTQMSLYVNGERYRREFVFPLTLRLPRSGENRIRVVATDSYGSSFARELTAWRRD